MAHLLHRPVRERSGYTVNRDVETWQVIGTTYPNGRTYKQLYPVRAGQTDVLARQDAEGRFRREHPATGGYHFTTRKVADFWRESDE